MLTQGQLGEEQAWAKTRNSVSGMLNWRCPLDCQEERVRGSGTLGLGFRVGSHQQSEFGSHQLVDSIGSDDHAAERRCPRMRLFKVSRLRGGEEPGRKTEKEPQDRTENFERWCPRR